jgi:hypothetical protein
MSKVNIASVVSRQIPEFIREDYPAFVSFIEAYYAYLQTEQVNLEDIKDLDETLDEFIIHFKKELAYNLPSTLTNERFLLERIKDQYLTKGSELSYKLLFRLMFGKDVQLTYPGQQMLRASDGRWNQESSVFAKVNYGDPEEIIGKVVTIEEGNRIIRVQVNKKLDLVGEVDRIVRLGDGVYEFFLAENIFDVVNPGNVIKYGTTFKATILPTTSFLRIYDKGQGFRVGQVFEVKSSTGTGTLIKVTKINDTGGILHAQIIKFGVGYLADFTASILPSDSLTSKTVVTVEDTVKPIYVTLNGSTNLVVGLERGVTTSELGFINSVDYIDPAYVDGAYAGTTLKEFFFETQTVTTANVKPALIEISLAAIAKYPGYYETNNGFLSDSIYIQDSKYYQIFSYVVRINERLDSYKTAVKTMLHPAGLALFGEFEISNTFDLSIALESLVKSLGIGVEDVPVVIEDLTRLFFYKELSSPAITLLEPTINNFVDGQTSIVRSVIGKLADPETVTVSDSEPVEKIITMGKEELLNIQETEFVTAIGLSEEDTQLINDNQLTYDIDTVLPTDDNIVDEFIVVEMNGTKYIQMPVLFINTPEFGYVVKDPYEEGNYFSEIYVNNRDAIFSS